MVLNFSLHLTSIFEKAFELVLDEMASGEQINSFEISSDLIWKFRLIFVASFTRLWLLK